MGHVPFWQKAFALTFQSKNNNPKKMNLKHHRLYERFDTAWRVLNFLITFKMKLMNQVAEVENDPELLSNMDYLQGW